MNHPPLPLCGLAWTPDLVSALADAINAIGRLDAQVSNTALAPAWHLRASWNGYAKALSLQHLEIEEIDIIAHACDLQLPGRVHLETAEAPFATLAPWQGQLAEPATRHWRENLPFTFDPPAAPALVRALTLLDNWARADATKTPWLAFPVQLKRMSITTRALPCLVVGDPGQRFMQADRPALLKRLLKQLRRIAEDGLARLDRLETFGRAGARALAREHRPGALAALGRLTLSRPCLAARSLAPLLGLTISGAGKLLTRAARLGLLIEISGRSSWRCYAVPDIAVSLGLAKPSRGRPRLPPPASPRLIPSSRRLMTK